MKAHFGHHSRASLLLSALMVAVTLASCSEGSVNSGGFVITVALQLDKSTVHPGDKLTGTVTYQNTSRSAMTIKEIGIATRPPGGTHSGGPFDNLSPVSHPGSVAAGATVQVTADRTYSSADPTGTWEAYATYEDSNNVWHDGPSIYFVVDPGIVLFNNGVFIIGVDGIRMDHAATWVANGINAQFRGPAGDQSGYTYKTMHSSLLASYPTMRFGPLGTNWTSAELSVPASDLLTLGQVDEPDAYSALSENLDALQRQYDSWKKKDYPTPVWLNFGGVDEMRSHQPYTTAIKYGDWLSNDVYPYSCQSWWPCVQGDPSAVGQALDAQYAHMQAADQSTLPNLTTWQQFAYVEMVNITSTAGPLADGGPNGQQVQTMMWNAVIHGARGIIFWDYNTKVSESSPGSPDVQRYIKANAGWLTSIGPVLQDGIIRPTLAGPTDSIDGCNSCGEDGKCKPIIHIGGRTTSGGNYYIVQNVSNSASWTGTITLPGATGSNATVYAAPSEWPTKTTLSTSTIAVSAGTITDTWGPNTVKVYRVY